MGSRERLVRDEQMKRFGRGGKKKRDCPPFEGERHHSLLLRVADQNIVDEEVENRAEQTTKKSTVKDIRRRGLFAGMSFIIASIQIRLRHDYSLAPLT